MELTSEERRMLRYIGFNDYQPRTAKNRRLVLRLMKKGLVFNPSRSFVDGADVYRLTGDGIMARLR